MSELKPCPFCGRADSLAVNLNTAETYVVRCGWCGGEVRNFPTEETAILSWNTRAIDPRLKQAVEEIETMGRNCMKGDVRKDGLLLASYIFEKHFPELKEAKDE